MSKHKNAGPKLTKEAEQLSKIFNRNAMFAHSAGIASDHLPREKVRGIMIARLNALLHGLRLCFCCALPSSNVLVVVVQATLRPRKTPC